MIQLSLSAFSLEGLKKGKTRRLKVLRTVPPNTEVFFAKVYDCGEKVDLIKGDWNPKIKI